VRYTDRNTQLCATTYISNVITLVIERHLLQELPKVISATQISELTDAEVIAIAGEEAPVRQQRRSIRMHMEDVEVSIAACADVAAKYNVLVNTQLTSPDHSELTKLSAIDRQRTQR
jgi:hypothetical protein